MVHKRSRKPAQAWQQLDLMAGVEGGHGVGGRHAPGQPPQGGGGYLNGCTPQKVANGEKKREKNGTKKIAEILRFCPNVRVGDATPDTREAALLDELDAMGLSRVMLQIARVISFDNFMAMWHILDASPELFDEGESGISLRIPRLSAYKRYQRNRFIEAMAAIGKTRLEITHAVKHELGEKLGKRHMNRLMAESRVKA